MGKIKDVKIVRKVSGPAIADRLQDMASFTYTMGTTWEFVVPMRGIETALKFWADSLNNDSIFDDIATVYESAFQMERWENYDSDAFETAIYHGFFEKVDDVDACFYLCFNRALDTWHYESRKNPHMVGTVTIRDNTYDVYKVGFFMDSRMRERAYRLQLKREGIVRHTFDVRINATKTGLQVKSYTLQALWDMAKRETFPAYAIKQANAYTAKLNTAGITHDVEYRLTYGDSGTAR